MKIDKKKPKHILFLLKATFAVSTATVVSPLLKKPKVPTTILYGHQLNGNIKAFLDYCQRSKKDVELYFLGDPWYVKTLQASSQEGLSGTLDITSFKDMKKAVKADAILTTHGLHIFHTILRHTGLKFIDVWHGIPYKGWPRNEFKEQINYDEVWVSSQEMKKLYESMYNFPPQIVKALGYARVDDLINANYRTKDILKKYKIEGFKKYILIAPTWKQDDQGRSIFPYGVTAKELFNMLEKVGKDNNALIIFRAHLNSGDEIGNVTYRHVKVMPHTSYPVTEEFLWIADVLVTDWSSIAFDYLPLKRPTIFLDVPSPFKAGFTLGPEHRFGFIATDISQLEHSLDRYVGDSEAYGRENNSKVVGAMRAAYGNLADGKAGERYFERLTKLTNR